VHVLFLYHPSFSLSLFFFHLYRQLPLLHSFPTRRSSDLKGSPIHISSAFSPFLNGHLILTCRLLILIHFLYICLMPYMCFYLKPMIFQYPFVDRIVMTCNTNLVKRIYSMII